MTNSSGDRHTRISVIIPAFNEAGCIGDTIQHLLSAEGGEPYEVIVSDGGSTDATLDIASKLGASALISPVKGRAGQMNHGVRQASGDVLYFVHADTRPPKGFPRIITEAIAAGHDHGSFRTRFDTHRSILRINAFFTRFDRPFFRGGDQSIWVKRELFERLGGYREDMLIMEEYELLERMREMGHFHLSTESTMISERKYDGNGWLRVQLANLKVVRMYRRGAGQEEMLKTYRSMLNYRKNAF